MFMRLSDCGLLGGFGNKDLKLFGSPVTVSMAVMISGLRYFLLYGSGTKVATSSVVRVWTS